MDGTAALQMDMAQCLTTMSRLAKLMLISYNSQQANACRGTSRNMATCQSQCCNKLKQQHLLYV